MPTSMDSVRAAYDLAAEAYAHKFIDELDHKPLDQEWLKEFAAAVEPRKPVLDVGCGPGHTTAFLTSLGVDATGVDLSYGMIAKAASAFPRSRFVVGDFCTLSNESSSVGGILAFYCIVHLQPDQLVGAFSEMFRVLTDGGVLLLSFHAGDKVVHVENFLESSAALDFTYFDPIQVEAVLGSVGFRTIDVRIRAPYESEYPSQRCYIFARKAKQET